MDITVAEDGRVSLLAVGIFAGPSKPALANDFISPLVGQQFFSYGIIFKQQVIEASLK